MADEEQIKERVLEHKINRWENYGLVPDANVYLLDRFKTEKELCDFIDYHAKHFAEDVLNIEYKSHKREFYLGQRINVSLGFGNMPHIDFMFEDNNGKVILVECKNPSNIYAELSNAIGQILSYYCTAKENGIGVDRMCIVTGRYNDKIRKVINQFNLPIEVYVMSKQNVLKVVN